MPIRRWTARGGQGEATAPLAWPPKPPGQMAGLVGSYEVRCSAPVPISQQRELDLFKGPYATMRPAWTEAGVYQMAGRLTEGVLGPFIHSCSTITEPALCQGPEMQRGPRPATSRGGGGANITQTDTAILRWLQTEMSPRVRGLGTPWYEPCTQMNVASRADTGPEEETFSLLLTLRQLLPTSRPHSSHLSNGPTSRQLKSEKAVKDPAT